MFQDRFGSHFAGVDKTDRAGTHSDFDWHAHLFAQANWKTPREAQAEKNGLPEKLLEEVEQMYSNCYVNYVKPAGETSPCKEILFTEGLRGELTND